MLIIMKPSATVSETQYVMEFVKKHGYTVDIFYTSHQTLIGVLENPSTLRELGIEAFSGVERIQQISSPFKLASKSFKPANTIINQKNIDIGENRIVIFVLVDILHRGSFFSETIKNVKLSGCVPLIILKWPTFSEETSLELLEENLKIAEGFGAIIWSEIISLQQIQHVDQFTDAWVTKTPDDIPLLQSSGVVNKPIVLERGVSSTIDEWLILAHNIISYGFSKIILSEQGVRTLIPHNTIDIGSIPQITELSHLPKLVDTSLIGNNTNLIINISKAAIVVGADAIILNAQNFINMGQGNIYLTEEYDGLLNALNKISNAAGRTITSKRGLPN